MTVVKGQGPDHILALLGYVMDGFRRDLVARMSSAAERPDCPSVLASLRGSQLRLLTMTPVEGMRLTDLAGHVGMTKQALGEFATVLEGMGLMESVRDPADRRVRILRPTAAGLEALAAGEAVISEIEAEWRGRVGTRKWDQLRSLLREVAGHFEF